MSFFNSMSNVFRQQAVPQYAKGVIGNAAAPFLNKTPQAPISKFGMLFGAALRNLPRPPISQNTGIVGPNIPMSSGPRSIVSAVQPRPQIPLVAQRAVPTFQGGLINRGNVPGRPLGLIGNGVRY